MGQWEIMKILKRNPNKLYTIKELSRIMVISPTTVATSIRKLEQQNLINSNYYLTGYRSIKTKKIKLG